MKIIIIGEQRNNCELDEITKVLVRFAFVIFKITQINLKSEKLLSFCRP